MAGGLAVIVLAIVALSFMGGTEGDPLDLDASLCPVDATAIAGRTVLLLDIGKPNADATAGLASELLHRVTLDMAANSELQVFVVAASPFAPRVLVHRLCKPYASDSLAVAAAKDRSGETRDCDDLPAQLSRRVRDRAVQFCEQRDALKRRIDGITARDWPAKVASAYLVEAIEDTRLELAQFANPKLYVFSDMLQHAAWYSHAERGPNGWDFDRYLHAREQQTGILSDAPSADPDLAVTVYYVPRRGLTEHPRVARAHQRFWRRYFVDVGSLTFDQQPLHVAYGVQPFTDQVDPAGLGPTAVTGREEESAARETGSPPQRQAAPEPASRADDGLADVPIVVYEDADAPATTVVAESETQFADPTGEATAVLAESETQDVGSADDAATAGASLPAAVATEPGQPDQEPAPAAGNDAGDSGQIPTIPASKEDAAPIIVAGSATGDPDQPPLNDPATDYTETSATSVSPERQPFAENPETTVDAEPSFCTATLKPEFEGVDVYPLGGSTRGRRWNYGSAEVLVGYTIDEYGETVDDDVAVQSARSTVEVPRYMDLFTRRAEQVVRGWSFEFDAEDGCEKRQSQVVRLQFQYRG
ncbi:MAG: hypothetical protein OXQ90_12740 [Gammaproteobacteria bacterium]|nr:hypothetical protein [Gammaproteobacteria bacterium]